MEILEESNQDENEYVFNFLHDRVQQATYLRLDTDQQKKTHLEIGRLLLKQSNNGEENLFDIVNHLNKGRELISDSNELHQLAELNTRTAKKARESTAYDAALTLLEVSMEILS